MSEVPSERSPSLHTGKERIELLDAMYQKRDTPQTIPRHSTPRQELAPPRTEGPAQAIGRGHLRAHRRWLDQASGIPSQRSDRWYAMVLGFQCCQVK
jgi:hypothetical protein